MMRRRYEDGAEGQLAVEDRGAAGWRDFSALHGAEL
jgi:hypothetical protein